VRFLFIVCIARGFSNGFASVSSKFPGGWWLGCGWMVFLGISDLFRILFGLLTCLSWRNILFIERYLAAKIGTVFLISVWRVVFIWR
jgi:hypothetical protein